MSNTLTNSGPILVFVLGPPCAGKSSLCTILSTLYNFDHFSIGNELHELISPNPSGLIANIKSKFTTTELEIFTHNVTQGDLAPPSLTTKFVKERMFPENKMPKNVRILIDGFPRQVTRWNVLKESIKDLWQPSKSSFAIILNVDRQMANQRFVDRGRQGDVFEKRFNQYMGTIGEIVGAMKRDGMTVMELSTGDGLNAHDTVHELERLPPWMENIGEGKKK